MTREEVFKRLQAVFRDVFDDRRLKISDETTSNDIVGWDSLVHINLIESVKDEFEIEFSIEEAYNTKNVGELVDIILAHLN